MKTEFIFSGDQTTLKVVDLTGDAWHDYEFYMEEARKSESLNDLHATNKALRAALGNLIAHLDGVVTGLHEKLLKTRKDFRSRKLEEGKQCTLRDRVLDLRRHAERQMEEDLPSLRLKLKPLRDILVHPNITKKTLDESSGRQIELTEIDLFNLTVKNLSREGHHISRWLDRLCEIYKYTRIHDTEEICDKFGKILGKASKPERM
jgi:regulator of replication initiation timing